MNISKESFPLSYYYNLDCNFIAVYKPNPRSKSLLPVGLLAVHVGGLRTGKRPHLHFLFEGCIVRSRQWGRLVCLKLVVY